MTVAFYDLQDIGNPLNGHRVAETQELEQLFVGLRRRPPFFCELIGEGQHKLLVGIAPMVGCVQHSSNDGNPPYLMAADPRLTIVDTAVEFLISGTPTPVPGRYLLPMGVVTRVASEFLQTELRSVAVLWEAIGPMPQ